MTDRRDPWALTDEQIEAAKLPAETRKQLGAYINIELQKAYLRGEYAGYRKAIAAVQIRMDAEHISEAKIEDVLGGL